MAEDITLKEYGTMILQNAGNDRTSDTAGQQTTDILNKQLWKPLISLS